LGLYRLMHCPPGKLWGHNCSDASNDEIKHLEKELFLVEGRTKADIGQLKMIKAKISGVLLPIYGQNPTEESFKETALVSISPFYQESAVLFTKVIDEYNKLSNMLDTKMKNTIQDIKTDTSGGRRKRRTKKRKLMRPRLRSRRT